jgi:hypothetical protein
MPQTCSRCSRLNPSEAAFCYHDGAALPGQRAAAAVPANPRFPSPIVFPSGQVCGSFDDLALCCQKHWGEAREMLEQGYLERFLGGLGRGDLARAAREAARFPDRNRGLDQFLAKLPGHALQAPRLSVQPREVNLGTLRIGADRHFTVRLENLGMRLLYGTVSCEPCVWLAVGDAPGSPQKVFDLTDHWVLPVHVRGRNLRAGSKPLEGRLVVESNGGSATVTVRLEVLVKPFPDGVLAGAGSPRALAEKARAAPKEAGALFESGAVEKWYRDNGWSYPVQAPAASGVAAVQQFFEALGLVKAPRMELSEEAILLHGRPGEKIEHVLAVLTHENRAAVAHAASNQPWLRVGQTRFRGRVATLPLIVPAVPARPGETLRATVSITANGNQRFVVQVSLMVGSGTASAAPGPAPAAVPGAKPAAAPVPVAVGVAPPPRRPRAMPPPKAPPRARRPVWRTLLPAGLLALTLAGVVLRDYLAPAGSPPPRPPPASVDSVPRLEVRFHDVKRDDVLEKLDMNYPEPTMRFGLVTLQKGKEVGSGAAVRRLTFDPWGRTNNLCLRFEGNDERLFGSPRGRWEESEAHSWKDDQGKDHEGVKSVWIDDDNRVQVTQFVELVRGEQSNLLDTCRVRYRIDNRDSKKHQVGLRFLLDTYIGANDGVPFTVPGDSDLCDTLKDLPTQANDKKVPDFLQALEKPDLAHPGTVAHLRLKLEDLKEVPVRVTLGAWPNEKLGVLDPKALGPSTLWDVPLLSMQALGLHDSAVVLYWKEQPLEPGSSRDVGFEYGLWNLASQDSRLAATVDGVFRPDGQLTVVAYVHQSGPEEGQETVTLTVPDEEGFKLLEGAETQTVPRLPQGAESGNRPVTWKVKAGATGKVEFTVKTGSGLKQTIPVEIKSPIFD